MQILYGLGDSSRWRNKFGMDWSNMVNFMISAAIGGKLKDVTLCEVYQTNKHLLNKFL
jgi:hypothetical protein